MDSCVSKGFGQERVLKSVTRSFEKGKIHGINQGDIDEMCDTVCEMDAGVMKMIRENHGYA